MFCSDPPHRFGDRFMGLVRGTWDGGPNPPDSLADRFNLLLALVCRLLGQGANPGRDPAMQARVPVAWGYLGRLLRRFIALAMRAQAGTLRPPPPRLASPRLASPRRAAPAPDAAAGPAAAPRTPSLLPRGRGWLRRLVPGLAPAAGWLHALLQDPDMVALVAMGPQAGRLLRPLCRAMDLPLPDYLRLPPQPRKPRPPSPARQAAQAARAAERAEAAWGRAFRRSLGLPARPPADCLPAHPPAPRADRPEPPATPAQARPPPKPA